MGYSFYSAETEIMYLNDSWEYDTLSFYKFCANDLHRINERIKNGEIITIIKDATQANAKTYLIENTIDFKSWVEKIYKGGFEKYIETGML